MAQAAYKTMINYFYLFTQTPLKKLMRVDKPT